MTLASQALEISVEHQFFAARALAQGVLGYSLTQLGRPGGIELIREGLAGVLKIGSQGGQLQFNMYLAEAERREGRLSNALGTIEQALATDSQVLAFRPETLRIHGELRLQLGQIELAKAAFCDANMLARKLDAKAWELRATMSLARLLRDTGRRDDARMILGEIYNWFTEGFDTADLKDAKALLDELAS